MLGLTDKSLRLLLRLIFSATLETLTVGGDCAYSALKRPFWLPIALKSHVSFPDNICLLVSASLPVFVALNLRLIFLRARET